MWYILDENNNPIPASSLAAAIFFKSERRIIARDVVGDASLSTVFLCLDHGFGHSNGPVLFESMWFGGSSDGKQRRYHTREEALEGHNEMLAEYKMNSKKWTQLRVCLDRWMC